MEFWKSILGFRDFAKSKEIEKAISHQFEHFELSAFTHIESLIFFKTQKQQTWLVATDKSLYCVLDDIGSDKFEIRWGIPKNELIRNNQVILELEINPNWKEKSGLIHFGEKHRNWLYSKAIYPDPDKLGRDIYTLIRSQMVRSEWEV